MSDRYLYRAKRTDNDEWVEGYYLFCPIQADNKHLVENFIYKHWIVTHNGNPFEVDPSTICQCTGLKDKNGKLIWENDIVDGHIKRGAGFYQCKVLWNECKARFDVRAMECNFPMTLDECTDDISVCGLDYEVIGNIFDNPELLEVEE